MKMLSLIISVSMIAILGFAFLASAQEASVYDSTEKVIIRAYLSGSSCSSDTPCSAHIEVRNSGGTFAVQSDYDPGKITVTGDTHTADNSVCTGSNTPYPCCTGLGAGICPIYQIHTNDLTSPDIGVSIDDVDGTAYVFCTKGTNPGWHTMTYSIQNAALVGACGASSGGTFTSKPAAYLCDVGDASTVSGTGPWSWTCTVAGTTPASCSANIQTWKITPSAGSGGSISPNSQQTVNNGATKQFTISANSGYTATVGGTCGGTPSTGTGTFTYTTYGITSDCTVSATFALTPVNGVCGSSNGGTFSSAPAANLCGDGSTPTVNGAGPWTWTCAGANGGQPASCSANKSLGTAELGFPMSGPFVIGISGGTGGSNGVPFSQTVTIVNTGNGPAGPFDVKVWFSPDTVINNASQLIYTWNVPGLAAGQSLTSTLYPLTYTGAAIHTGYYLVIKIDADNQVVENNKADCFLNIGGDIVAHGTVGCNTYAIGVFVYR